VNVWLITVGEQLPIDGRDERLGRTGTLARLLVEKGHRVVWWTSTFNHAKKRHRFLTDTHVDISESLRISLLHANSYKRHVSLARALNHYRLAQRFKALARTEPRPDIILCSLPTLELSLAATQYGDQHNVPVVLDVRDLWPDILLDVTPPWAQWIAFLASRPAVKILRKACRRADAITGITPSFVDWGLRYAGRPRTELDRDFPLAYTSVRPNDEAIERAEEFWRRHHVGPRSEVLVVCYMGFAGQILRLKPVLEAARKLQSSDRQFLFVLCGNHDQSKLMATDCKNVLFPGWIGAPEIWSLMRRASVGLLPYTSRRDFENSIPNKVIEYLSAGLPVLSSVRGALGTFLEQNACGRTYCEDNSDTLVEVLCELYDAPALLDTLSQNAHALYKRRFVAEIVYDDMISHLERVRRFRSSNALKHQGMGAR
jgi:glycosyltransferase involved in cell wall biosynthesis